MKEITVAIAGNPNVGKSTIFNALTGANQHVGNWPGKTVEQKTGHFKQNGIQFNLVDLPGTYSLSAFSPEEMIAREYIIQEHPDIVVIVADAANLERNLYLTVQILEMGVPAMLLLNMMDAADSRGIQINTAVLQQKLGIPVLTAVARKSDGLQEMIETITQIVNVEASHAIA
ncbi:MAG: GTP-binding protein [Chloroflexi bacterium]|nr:MAG: GTP-binding protein [Chloroflexota bacterium]